MQSRLTQQNRMCPCELLANTPSLSLLLQHERQLGGLNVKIQHYAVWSLYQVFSLGDSRLFIAPLAHHIIPGAHEDADSDMERHVVLPHVYQHCCHPLHSVAATSH